MKKLKNLLQKKLELLASEMGFDHPESMLWEHEFSSNSPSICIREECNQIYHQNPYISDGKCFDCGTKSVMSCQMLQDKIQS